MIPNYTAANAKIVYQKNGTEEAFPETYECVKLGTSGTSYPSGEKYFSLDDLEWDGMNWRQEYFYMPEFENKVDELWDVWLYGFAVHKNESEDGYNRLYIYEIRPEIIVLQDNN